MITGLLTFFVVSYTVFIGAAVYSWLKLPKPELPDNYQPQTRLTVLVAVRNEATAIRNLLQGLEAQTYPRTLFEVIIIDDHSEDETVAIVEDFTRNSDLDLKFLWLENGRGTGKKSALALGLEHATGSLIVQTDGDCRVQPDWLTLLEFTFVHQKAKFISGPVCLEAGSSFFEKMQVVEFASLIGSGAASIGLNKPTMCNGANLAYEKAAFYEVNGFTGNEQIPSGDDEFLMHKIQEHFPGKVAFLKASGATVFTSAQTSFSGFIAQRVRWASKWKFYQNLAGQILALLIFGVNLMLFIAFFAWLYGILPGTAFWLSLIIKSGGDIVFLALILKFHRRLKFLVYALPLQLVYIPYVLYCALAGLTGTYKWKGRNLQNP